MNQVFNIKRFLLVLKQDLALNFKRLIISFVLMTLPFVLAYSTVSIKNGPSLLFFIIGIFGGMFYAVISSSNFCKQFASKTQCINYLTLPSSNLEKYTSQLLFKVIIPLGMWTLVYYIAEKFYHEPIHMPKEFYGAMLFICALLSSICLFWGSIFRRFAFVAAAVAVTLSLILVLYFIRDMDLMFLDPIRVYIQTDGPSALYNVLTIIDVVFFIVSVVLSYLMVSRKQLIVKSFKCFLYDKVR